MQIMFAIYNYTGVCLGTQITVLGIMQGAICLNIRRPIT